jgi:hypothetical protein
MEYLADLVQQGNPLRTSFRDFRSIGGFKHTPSLASPRHSAARIHAAPPPTNRAHRTLNVSKSPVSVKTALGIQAAIQGTT